MPTYVLKNMYHAHIGSLINYCNIIWANICPTNLTPLTLILKRAIRNVTKSDFLAHTEPLFKNMKILALEGTRKLSLALHFFNSRDINIPPLLATHRYHTRHRDRRLHDTIHRDVLTPVTFSTSRQILLIKNDI